MGEPGQTGDSSLVTAYGAGLERGTTGELTSADLKALSFSLPAAAADVVTAEEPFIPAQECSQSSSSTPKGVLGLWR